MKNVSHLAIATSLFADPTRAKMLQTLLDARFHTVSELAMSAGVTPQTASYHLAKMLELNIVQVKKYGRHRYYQFISKDMVPIIESLLCIAPEEKINSLKQFDQNQAIRYARTCYDHLAGKLGVLLTDTLVENNILQKNEDNFILTQTGEKFLINFGINLQSIRKKRRSFARCCLDWSERRHHLAGALGQAILEHLFNLKWIVRLSNTRAVKVTSLGIKEFKQVLSMDLE
ncbi:ArsR/SmtB family transcription factor [Thermoflavimicrobium daqui]|uniref:Transcriptional regulator n=1 Tax=Thermoflavimicrobium daqui TaxID=2137476 RepID=A0A364K0P1_9BACL|nr:winged helix-turn-helix domain-containing protein [Thermoflavimicrobium daqui]RAL20652.1 transcriptional regulator [Thermoflavimicrobium daqui]